MAQSGLCSRQKLAEGNVGLVEECRCGKIHLSVGPITMHFDLEAFEALARTLQAAVQERHVRQQRAANDLRLLLGERPLPVAPSAGTHRPD